MSTLHGTALENFKAFKTFSGMVIGNLPEIEIELTKKFSCNADAINMLLAETFTRENLDRALMTLGKKSEPKPSPSVLKLVRKITLLGRTTKFIPKESYVANLRPGFMRVKLAYVDPEFIVRFGDKVEELTGEATLCSHVLTRPSVFALAMKEVRDSGIATKTTPGELWLLLERQSDGPRSNMGSLLTNGYPNLFEMDDINAVACVVVTRWDDDYGGWRVCVANASGSGQWSAGHQLFSRNSRLPLAA